MAEQKRKKASDRCVGKCWAKAGTKTAPKAGNCLFGCVSHSSHFKAIQLQLHHLASNFILQGWQSLDDLWLFEGTQEVMLPAMLPQSEVDFSGYAYATSNLQRDPQRLLF